MAQKAEFEDWLEHALQEAAESGASPLWELPSRPEDIIERLESATIAYTGHNLVGRDVPVADHLDILA